jgi:DNA-binding CsgD family transcriptional regulator
VSADLVQRVQADVARAANGGLDWVGYSASVGDAIGRVIPFDRFCWHTVDPGTILFTGSVNRNIACSGSWLAHYEYAVEDINKWAFLAHSGRLAGATSIGTHGDMSRSARHRSHESMGLGDELRVSLVSDGIYWGAAAFLRDQDEPWFTEAEVRTIAALAGPIAGGLRRAILNHVAVVENPTDYGPGVIVFDAAGEVESISPAAERWVTEMVEFPTPRTPAESKMVQAIAVRVRNIDRGKDPLELAARARVRTRAGAWLLLYGTRLSGGPEERTAVIIQPATPQDVVPVVALAYGLSQRECHVTMQCIQGRSTKQIARALSMSPYTVQDHLKSIFDKTGVRSRGELVGQVFLEHYAPRWQPVPEAPDGWWVGGMHP